MADESDEPKEEKDQGAAQHEGESKPAPGAEDRSTTGDGDASAQQAADDEAAKQAEQFRESQADVFDHEVDGAAARAEHRAATQNLQSVNNTIDQATIGTAIFGFAAGYAAPVVDGPVPAAELDRLADTFARPDCYAELAQRIRDLRVIALHGLRGTGRTSTALKLLSDMTGGQVKRVDPAAALADLADFDANTGYLFEPRVLDLETDALLMHFDRLAGVLDRARAYAVILVEGTGTSEPLVRSRYGCAATSATADDILTCHLGVLLADEGPEVQRTVLAKRADHDVADALGLTELLPAEAALLADLLAMEHRKKRTREEVLAVCRIMASRQVHAWFADLHRFTPDSGTGPLVQAVFSLAVAVYNGASYDLAAEAAESLAWELAVTADPETAPGRTISGQDPRARLAAVRAGLADGSEQVGRSSVPVRIARFENSRLVGMVLSHAWERHHNLRGPLVRWLQQLGENRRTVAWVRAAVVLGALARLDFPYVFNEAILPLAESGQVRGELFAATALDAAARDESVRPAVRSLMRDWRRGGRASLRITATFVHGYGRVAGSVAESVRELRRIGIADEGKYAAFASHNLVQLLGGAEPATVLRRVVAWIDEDSRTVADLGLLVVLRMCSARVGEVWDPDEAPALEPFERWPLPLGLITAYPEVCDQVADALWVALRTGRTGAATLKSVADWLRRCNSNEQLARAAARLLPHLVSDQDDCDRLWHLVEELAADPEEPLDRPVAKRLAGVLKRVEESL